MRKQGFTLIELLIVITILTILVGAAIPYVNSYLDDARMSTAKSDLNELKNAIMRYEVDQATLFNPGFGKTGDDYIDAMKTFQNGLVGGYLVKSYIDPWGRPYYYSFAASIVFSAADDGDVNTNIISMDVRPVMAPSKAWWTDCNNNSKVDVGDYIDIKFSRPIGGYNTTIDLKDNFKITPNGNPTVRTNPFGDGAVIESFASRPAGQRKHPKGNNWIRINICPNADMEVGDNIIASSSFVDTTEASVIGLYTTGMGLYEDDKVQYEPMFANNGTIHPTYSHDNMIRLKSAQ